MGSIAINRLVSRIISAYDHNHNGVVELQKPQREVDRREVRHTPDYIEYSTWTREKLFAAADTNKDQKVTAEELTAQVAKFDTNGDGKLETRGWVWNPRKEYEHFEAAFGEELLHQTHVPLPHPPTPPIPPHVPTPIGPRGESKTMLA